MKRATVDRKNGPAIAGISDIRFPNVDQAKLDNGIPLYLISMGTQDVLKIELIFEAGRPYERKRLAARATASMLKEGAGSMSSQAIAEKIDYYGATLSTTANFDTATITLYCLKRHLPTLLDVIRTVWLDPIFPDSELQRFARVNQQSLQVELAKNDVLAYRILSERVFGSDHPYGYNSFPKDYDALHIDDLRRHYSDHFGSNNCFIILSGKIDSDAISIVNRSLGQHSNPSAGQMTNWVSHNTAPEKIKEENRGNHQAAIRIGRKLFDRSHPDYVGLFVLNTIFGGYFGSRLMANIREDKGYTYSIYSAIDSLRMDGYFYVHTEVGHPYVEKTLAEIYKEMAVLHNQLVTASEMQMVKNYIFGNLLRMLDGPFNVCKVVKTIVLSDEDFSYFQKMLERIRAIDAHEIRRLARTYLTPEQLWEVVVTPR